jgi:hypothetical protein
MLIYDHDYPPELFGDDPLRYPGWFASGNITEPGANIYYCNLTVTRKNRVENTDTKNKIPPDCLNGVR